MKRFLLVFGLVCVFLFQKLSAQSLYEVSLDEKVEHASLIVEGKVLSQKSFWNPQHSIIYTSNKVQVTKVFKGSDPQNAVVEILTVGGSIEGDYMEASDLLVLFKDQVGMFFCFPNSIKLKSPETNQLLLEVYASSQGFLSYNLAEKKAIAPFATYRITEELYPAVQAKTRRAYKDLDPSFKIENLTSFLKTTAAAITDFSPTSVTAGALLDPATNVLTINGSGFGTASGSAAVLFDDANDGIGGIDYVVVYNDPLIISWSDAQIQVRVPSRAGTGTIKVRDAAAAVSPASSATLNVLYSILTASFSISSVIYTKESNLMNANGSGGYTVLYSTNTAGSGVDFDASATKGTFQRALNTWKEINGYNVIEGGSTTIQAINGSDANVIMFDNANTTASPLPAGVLAVCYSFNSICSADPVNYQARKVGFDVVVRNSGYSTGSTTFSVGPCPPNSSNYMDIDLQTVLYHELGHSLNLGHVNDSYQGSSVGYINPGKLMNFAVVNSVKRVSPDYAAYVGANYAITPQGNQYGTCTTANTEMIPLAKTLEPKDECPAIFPAAAVPQNTVVAFDLIHTTSNKYTDPIFTRIKCDGTGAAVTNNAWYAFKTNGSTGNTLNLTVSGYTTSPAALTACTQVYTGIPVTGVRLALYQLSSCPAPASFPAPVACAVITGDGSLPPVSGLSANTSYAIYVDGIENTKATFNLSLGGFVLPIKLKDFSGKAVDDYNLLSWRAEAITGVEALVLQKSGDGLSFSDLTRIVAVSDIQSGSFKDPNPFGKTYYRLAIKNNNRQTDYSDIVLLQRNGVKEITIYPNPVKNVIYIQVNNPVRTMYTFKLYNNTGQLVSFSQRELSNERTSIAVPGLAKGIYNLVASTDKDVVKTYKILVD